MGRHAREGRLVLGVALIASATLLRCGSNAPSSPSPADGGSGDATTDSGPLAEAGTDAGEGASSDDASGPPDAPAEASASDDASDAPPACQPTCAHHPCGTNDGCGGTCAPSPPDAGDDGGAESCVATAYYTVTFGDPLFGDVCATSSDRNTTSCSAGAKRYCQALGFGTGFPEQTITTAVGILCVAAPAVDLGNVPLATLTGFISTCTSSNLYSIDCEAASDDYCTGLPAGYVAGFGPNEVDGTNVSVSCLPASVAVAITNVPVTDFESPASSCCTTDCDQGRNQNCDATAANYCTGSGYVGGFGPLQASATQATVFCITE